MKTALIALALVAVTATAAPVRKPAFALAQAKSTSHPAFAKIRAMMKESSCGDINRLLYDYADYYIWDENQDEYAYKGRDGKKVSLWEDDNWNFEDYGISKYGLNWEKDWRFGRFWFSEWCEEDGCDEKYAYLEECIYDDDALINWVLQWSDADWKKYGDEIGMTKEEFEEAVAEGYI